MLLTISDITNLESFCNSNNVISLNCIILGDNFDDIFTLEISCICLDNGIFLLEINIVKLATRNKWRMYSHRSHLQYSWLNTLQEPWQKSIIKKTQNIMTPFAVKGDEIRGANGIYNKESRTIGGKGSDKIHVRCVDSLSLGNVQPVAESRVEKMNVLRWASDVENVLTEEELIKCRHNLGNCSESVTWAAIDPRELIYYINRVAEFGFNHIIIVGETEYGMIFIDCYGRVFMWDDESPMLWPLGNSPEEYIRKPQYIHPEAREGSKNKYIYNLSFLSQGRCLKKFGAKFIYYEDIKYSKVRPLRSYASSGNKRQTTERKQIGSKITLEEYNNFLIRKESSGYKYQRKSDVTNGDGFHFDPTVNGGFIAADVAVAPHLNHVQQPIVLYPGPPPGDKNGNPHA
ncbi:hypothetical protein GLOIN_2v1480847 [Rhizophagus irregularis DAOM 181602=DAOM 197198]|nr:hypothetical protein GLOIN_2v1480847 [Rhizophagus irregularis DAOM 181602=DAOM 197198]